MQEGYSCAKSSFGDLQITYFNWLDRFYPAYQVSSGRLSTQFSSGAIWWGRKYAIGEMSLRPKHGLSTVLRLISGSHAAVSGSRESVVYV